VRFDLGADVGPENLDRYEPPLMAIAERLKESGPLIAGDSIRQQSTFVARFDILALKLLFFNVFCLSSWHVIPPFSQSVLHYFAYIPIWERFKHISSPSSGSTPLGSWQSHSDKECKTDARMKDTAQPSLSKPQCIGV
jgi:hypothetical protein